MPALTKYLLGFCLAFACVAMQAQTLPVALDTPSRTYDTSTDAPWQGQTTITHDGVDAAIGVLPLGSSASSVSTTVTGPATVSFWWKLNTAVSSLDTLTVEVDAIGVSWLDQFSGSQWRQGYVDVPDGDHVVSWTYGKDADLQGDESAYLDQVVVTPVTQKPLIISSLTPPAVYALDDFTYSIQAVRLPTSYNATGLPAWATFDPDTATISGKPNAVGVFNVTISATNSIGTTTATLKITVLAPVPVISSPTFAEGSIGEEFGYQIVASNLPTSYSATGLPAGFTVDSTGIVSGTFPTPGVITFTVKATNEWGTTSQVVKVAVDDGKPIISSDFQLNYTGEETLNYEIVASRNPTHYAARYLVDGLTLDESTGTLSGDPTVADGTYQFVLEAWNSHGKSWQWMQLNVNTGLVTPPSITHKEPDHHVYGIVGQPMFFSVYYNATGSALSVNGLPADFTVVNADIGLVEGTPSAPGVTTVTYTFDTVSDSFEGKLILTILPANAGLATAIDTANPVASGGSSGAFASQTTTKHDGVDAAQSPVLTSGQQSYLAMALPGPGIVRFWWKMVGDAGDSSARMELTSDGANVPSHGYWDVKKSPNFLKSPTDWVESSFVVEDSAGGVLRWIIDQNATAGATQERLYIDQVTFTALDASAPIVVTEYNRYAGSVPDESQIYSGVRFFGAYPITAQWSIDGAAVGDPANFDGAGGVTSFTDLPVQSIDPYGVYRVTLSNSVGSVDSHDIPITSASFNAALELGSEWKVWAAAPGTTPIGASQTTDTHDGVDAFAMSSPSFGGGSSLHLVRNSGQEGYLRIWAKLTGPAGTEASIVDDFSEQVIRPGAGWTAFYFSVPAIDVDSPSPQSFTVYLGDAEGAKLVIDQVEFLQASAVTPLLGSADSGSRVYEAGELVELSAYARNYQYAQWKKNGTAIPGAMGTRLKLYNLAASDAGSYSCTFTNGVGSVTSTPVAVSVVALSAALDNPGGVFPRWSAGNQSSSASWNVQTSVKHNGTSALKTGAITHSQSTWLQSTFRGPGVLAFWNKVSSQPLRDDFYFYDPGTESNNSRAGELDWHLEYVTLPAGDHTLYFEYTKDAAVNGGSDAAWMDGAKFVPGDSQQPTILSQPRGVLAEAGSNVQLNVVADGTVVYYQWKKNGVAISGATSPSLVFSSVASSNVGSYTCDLYSPYGTLTTNAATIALTTTLGSAVDLATTKWNTQTGPAWANATTGSHDGTDSLKATLTGTASRTTLAGMVTGPKKLSFFTQLEGDVSELEVLIDGVPVAAAHQSAPLNWSQAYVLIPSGVHRVEFVAEQNSDSTSSEIVWLDQLTLSAPTWITTPPQSQLVTAGQDVTFSITTDGLPTTYQWKKNGTIIPGATQSTLTLTAVPVAAGGSYTCAMDNGLVSTAVTLGVVSFPAATYAKTGSNPVIKLTTGGTGMTYAWRRDSTPLSGSKYSGVTSSALTIKAVAHEDEGTDYYCDVTLAGSTLSVGPMELMIVFKPVINDIFVPAAVVSGLFALPLTATEYATTFKVTGLPAGMSYDPVTQTIIGKPNASTPTGRPIKVTVVATNAWGNSDAVTFDLVIDPMPPEFIGKFVGIVPAGNRVNSNYGGMVTINVTGTGDYTGTLLNGKLSHSLKGRLNVQTVAIGAAEDTGSAARQVISRASPLSPLWIDFSVATNRVATCSITTAADDADGAEPLPFSAVAPLPAASGPGVAGKYNMSLTISTEIDGIQRPAGYGWMQFTISNAGAVTISVRTPDGVALTGASAVGVDSGVPCWFLMYNGAGALAGDVALNPDGEVPPVTSAATGTFAWIKTGPASTTDRTYRSGFYANDLLITGDIYHPPTASDPIFLGLTDVLAGDVNAGITFNGDEVKNAAQIADLQQAFRLNSVNVPFFTAATNPCSVKLSSISPATGLFAGSFTLTDTTTSGAVVRPVSFYGLAVPDVANSKVDGVGYFLINSLPATGTSIATQPFYSGYLIMGDTSVLQWR